MANSTPKAPDGTAVKRAAAKPTAAVSVTGCAETTRPVRKRAAPDAPWPTRVNVLSSRGGREKPPSENNKPRIGAMTTGFSNALSTIDETLWPAPAAASTRTSESGVTRTAAVATATATETEADRLKTAAITGRPADPTLGPDAVRAISALSRRSALNWR